MAHFKLQFLVPVLLLLMLVAAQSKTPPGIEKNPSNARCLIKKYKHCYNSVHVCPKFCPDQCTVECLSCKPICSGGSTPPPNDAEGDHDKGKGDDHGDDKGDGKDDDHGKGDSKGYGKGDGKGDGHDTPPVYPTPSIPVIPSLPTYPPPPTPTQPPSTPSFPNPSTPSPTPPTTTPPSPSTPTPTPSTPYPTPPSTTPPSPSTPSPSTPYPTPPTTTPPSPSTPTPGPSIPSPSPSTPSPTPPRTPSPTPPSTTPSTPSSPTPSTPSSPSTPPYPTPSPSTPTPPSSETSPATARCRNTNYPQCYNMEHVCPRACPGGCEVDCITCKPVCRCDRPGAVCQDPRFIGGDGITFYFHGKKEKDFCLVSDSNIHINAHFIGRRNDNMKRDFTWVQSIAILFDKHQLFIGALKTSTWDDSIDRLAFSFDGEPVNLPEADGSKWQSTNVSITRVAETNNAIVEVEGKFKITANVVPISEEDLRIHSYGITKEDCFAHLDLGFKFYSLSDEVNGVLGQTYRPDYVTKVNMGANMPLMGGDRDFETSSLFAADCAVARFNGAAFDGEESMKVLELPSLSCDGGIDGKGVVCER